MKTLNKEICPVCDKKMYLTTKDKTKIFRGVKINYKYQAYVCTECGIETGTIEQASGLQKIIADAYRKKTGLLTGEEIHESRKKSGLTQKELADIMGVGIASIKRWENGVIQSRSMDKSLRAALKINQYRADLIESQNYLINQIGDNKNHPLKGHLEVVKTLMDIYEEKQNIVSLDLAEQRQ